MNIVEVKNISKSFQDGLFSQKKIVLQDVSLTVKQGDFVFLQGANGAGKSTLIKIILGLQDPDIGSVRLFSISPKSPASKVRIGTVFQEVTPPDSLTVSELIDLVRSYYPDALPTEKILKTFDLIKEKNTFANTLSGGNKQRLYFALALVGNPHLLILDEPTKGLDIEGQKTFWQQIERWRANSMTIIMVSHIESDRNKLQSLATHIITLANGKLTFDKSPEKTAKIDCQEIDQPSNNLSNTLKVLSCQTRSEILQLLRNPSYLAGVILFSAVAAIISSLNADQLQTLTLFSAISIWMFSLERSSKRIAMERDKGWLKLLRVTPLPPILYITAKLIMTMIVLAVSLLTIFGVGLFKSGVNQSLGGSLTLIIGLLLVSIPLIAIGIALGYILKPKDIDPIVGLSLPIGALASGLVPIQNPSFVKDIIVVFPFFHYREIVQFLAGMDYDQYLLIHVLWLAFYTVLAIFIAKIAYQRDGVSL